MFCMHNQLPSEHFVGQKKHEMNHRMESQPPKILWRLWGFKGELGPFVVSAGTLVPAACLFMKKSQRLMLKSFERLIQMNGCQMAWFIMVGMISFFNWDIRLHHVMLRHYHKHLVHPPKITFSQCFRGANGLKISKCLIYRLGTTHKWLWILHNITYMNILY